MGQRDLDLPGDETLLRHRSVVDSNAETYRAAWRRGSTDVGPQEESVTGTNLDSRSVAHPDVLLVRQRARVASRARSAHLPELTTVGLATRANVGAGGVPPS